MRPSAPTAEVGADVNGRPRAVSVPGILCPGHAEGSLKAPPRAGLFLWCARQGAPTLR